LTTEGDDGDLASVHQKLTATLVNNLCNNNPSDTHNGQIQEQPLA